MKGHYYYYYYYYCCCCCCCCCCWKIPLENTERGQCI